MIPKTLIFWTIIKEISSGLYFHAMLPILIQSCIYKGKNVIKNCWQQTTKSIFTDINKVDSTIPFIKKNLFLPGYYTPKPLKPVTFTLKQKILGSTLGFKFVK